MRRRRYGSDSQFRSQMARMVSRAALPQGIWTVRFRALWPLVGTQLIGRAAMNKQHSANARPTPHPALAGIHAWMPSEIKAISPLVDQLMRFIEGLHCV